MAITARRRTVRRVRGSHLIPGAFMGMLALMWLAAHPLYAVLLAALLAGAVALYVRHRVGRHDKAARRATSIATYHQMDPAEFEHALAALCRRDGCRRVEVVGGAGDLAADVLYVAPDGRRGLIQAKRYARGNNVGSPDVQCVGGTYSVVHGAQHAAVVTTSGFTKDAWAYGARAGIRLFDEAALAAWASRTGPAPWVV